VEPVEINAGAWYLRGIRSDPRYALEGHADAALGITVQD
jgi:hypothetical protein